MVMHMSNASICKTYVDVIFCVKYLFLLLLSFLIRQEATSPGCAGYRVTCMAKYVRISRKTEISRASPHDSEIFSDLFLTSCCSSFRETKGLSFPVQRTFPFEGN